MRAPASIRARDPHAAGRTAVLVLLVCAVAMVVFSLFGPNASAKGASWATSVLLAGLALVYRVTPVERLDRRGGYLLIAVTGVVLACAMNWITQDSSAGAQAFLAFPVLWAAVNLRGAAVALVTALALLLDGMVLFGLRAAGHAVSDLSLTGAVMVAVAAMLVRAGDRQERLVAMLQRQATVDSLTGLVNRRVLDEALAGALDAPGHPEGTALVVLDVDSFKTINDTHGHPVGDDALVHVAGLLRSVVRSGDAVLGRMGGDELAVLLPGCPADVAERRATELLDAVLATPLLLPDGSLLAISASLGVAHAPSHASGLEELYAAADHALYAAKRGGRGRVAVAGA